MHCETYAERTAYPKVFEFVSWGRFEATADLPDPAIVANRNSLAQMFRMKTPRRVPQYVAHHFAIDLDLRFWDHVEIYDAGNKWVVITSPYGPVDYEVCEGFVPIEPVYSLTAKSYLGTVPKRRRSGNRDRSPTRKPKASA